MDCSTIAMNTTKQTASTVELHSSVIRGITISLFSEHFTELTKGVEVGSSRFQNVEYCLPKTEILKYEVVSSTEVVSPKKTI